MPLCKARHCDKYLYFECDKRVRFYRPYRCGEKAIKGEKLCEGCKNVIPSKTQMSRGFPHGLVGGPIPSESHAYGSVWYLKQVAKYGEPSKETLAAATEYLEEPFDITAGAGMTAELFREEAHSTSKKSAASMPPKARSGAAAAAATAAKKRSGAGKKKKDVVEEEPAATKTSRAPPTYLKDSAITAAKKQRENAAYIIPRVRESFIEPVDVCEVDYVDVAEFTFHNCEYYRNTKTNELYEMTASKGMGRLIGLYDEEAEEIQPCDAEEEN
jgi:hypothetical protein